MNSCFQKFPDITHSKTDLQTFATTSLSFLGHKPGGDLVKTIKKIGGSFSIKNFRDIKNGKQSFIDFYDEQSWVVHMGSSKDMTSKNFALATAIGHYVLHYLHLGYETGKFDTYSVYYNDKRDLAQQAFQFASLFLMPCPEMMHSWDITNGNIRKLADVFGVSEKAILVRASIIGLNKKTNGKTGDMKGVKYGYETYYYSKIK